MSASSVTPIDAFIAVPEFSVLELAIVIVFARQPGIDVADVVVEIGRWFNTTLVERDLTASLRRLLHREWLTTDGQHLHATDEARRKAEFAARGIVHLVFRDRFFFDVAKLLDVCIVKEDRGSAN